MKQPYPATTPMDHDNYQQSKIDIKTRNVGKFWFDWKRPCFKE